jgi:transposase
MCGSELDFARGVVQEGGMSKTFRPWDVEQAWLLPPSVRELVPEGHVAHFVRELVREELDLSAIVGVYKEERGYPPYHPVMMTALLLYAYTQGVFSSRKVARACEERVDFMAVTAMQTPDHRTVCEFRRRHLDALAGLFGQVLHLCQRAGLVKLGHVALDGTKVKANASKHKAMSYERIGEFQDSCRPALQACLAFESPRSGLRQTTRTGFQERVSPLQRSGWRRRAAA